MTLKKDIQALLRLGGILLAFFVGTITQGQNLALLDSLDYSTELNDVWGYTDPQGQEYALVGLTNGVSIVDIHSDSTNIQEVAFVPGPSSIWRDLKTYNGFAYVVTEADTGLLIIDLRQLPQVNYRYDTLSIGLVSAHNLFIDSNGYAFVFGSNLVNGGAVILDLNTADPFQPALIGTYDEDYIHDGYVRNDTLWSAEIYQGWIAVVDVTDPANPQRITTFNTPSNFAHNCWLSDDGKTLFTTDERPFGQVAAYDVSDLDNVEQVGQYQKDPGTGMIPHNVFYKGGYLITSYYRQGVTITDAHRPSNLVEVGWFDTNPIGPGPGFQGCWGVYPYLPSGKILATDRQTGLFVLRPTYTRAGYLEGTVRDPQGIPYANTQVTIEGLGSTFTDFSGQYRLGVPQTGLYDVEAFRSDCPGQRWPSIFIQQDSVTQLDLTLNCTFTSIDQVGGQEQALWWAEGHLYWHLEKASSILLYNAQGQLVHQQTVSGNGSLSTIGFPAGYYHAQAVASGRPIRISWTQP